jgi:hypothetical protein
MKTRSSRVGLGLMLACLTCLITGCESTDGGDVSGGAYYGTGFYDPWYYGGYYDAPDVIVTPPPPRPVHPIAPVPPAMGPRPMPLPSIPARPMPRAR